MANSRARSACPRCGSEDLISRVRREGASERCSACGLSYTKQRNERTGKEFLVAKPASGVREHRSHPHHYVALMLGFFVVAILVVFVLVSQLSAAYR